MVYGKEGVFDADRLIDLLRALEAFRATQRAPEAEELLRATAQASGASGAGLVQDMQRTETKVRQASGGKLIIFMHLAHACYNKL